MKLQTRLKSLIIHLLLRTAVTKLSREQFHVFKELQSSAPTFARRMWDILALNQHQNKTKAIKKDDNLPILTATDIQIAQALESTGGNQTPAPLTLLVYHSIQIHPRLRQQLVLLPGEIKDKIEKKAAHEIILPPNWPHQAQFNVHAEQTCLKLMQLLNSDLKGEMIAQDEVLLVQASACAYADVNTFERIWQAIATESSLDNTEKKASWLSALFYACTLTTNFLLAWHLVSNEPNAQSYFQKYPFTISSRERKNTPLHFLSSYSFVALSPNDGAALNRLALLFWRHQQQNQTATPSNLKLTDLKKLKQAHLAQLNLIDFLLPKVDLKHENHLGMNALLCAVRYGDWSTVKRLNAAHIPFVTNTTNDDVINWKTMLGIKSAYSTAFELASARDKNDAQRIQIASFVDQQRPYIRSRNYRNMVLKIAIGGILIFMFGYLYSLLANNSRDYDSAKKQLDDIPRNPVMNDVVLQAVMTALKNLTQFYLQRSRHVEPRPVHQSEIDEHQHLYAQLQQAQQQYQANLGSYSPEQQHLLEIVTQLNDKLLDYTSSGKLLGMMTGLASVFGAVICIGTLLYFLYDKMRVASIPAPQKHEATVLDDEDPESAAIQLSESASPHMKRI